MIQESKVKKCLEDITKDDTENEERNQKQRGCTIQKFQKERLEKKNGEKFIQ